MSKIDEIYKVHNGKMLSIPIIRETSKCVFVNPHDCFDYLSRLRKVYVFLTPLDAAKAECDEAEEQIGIARKQLDAARARARTAMELLTEARRDEE